MTTRGNFSAIRDFLWLKTAFSAMNETKRFALSSFSI